MGDAVMFRVALFAVALAAGVGVSAPILIHDGHKAAVAKPAPRKVYPFSLTFASQVNTYALEHNKPPIEQVTCLRGSQDHYACALWLTGKCRLVFAVQQPDGVVDVERAGVPLMNGPTGKAIPFPRRLCYARQVFKRVFKG